MRCQFRASHGDSDLDADVVETRPRPPLPWFLPGAIRIRGGAARKFASVRRFHRGIQAEST